ncbi:MAG: RICIN domain-containing protein [Clostridia bacterium]|nr:RICIN domain-containing protein [Clostridia bacterium]
MKKQQQRMIKLIMSAILIVSFTVSPLNLIINAVYDVEGVLRRPPNPIQIPSSISISKGEAYYLDPIYILDNGEYYTWSSSNTSVATVTTYGLVNGISGGSATITVVLHTNDYGTYTKTCSVSVSSSALIASGTYFIENINAGKYIDVEGPSTANGAAMQLWELTGASQRKWIIQIGSDGYFRVKSKYSLKYMRVTTSGSSPGETITQYSTSSVNGAKWALMRTSAGNYAFVPASSTDSLVVLNAPGASNGYDLNTATYTANLDYKDEWKLYDVNSIYGSKSFRTLNTNMYTAINCHGYAMFRNDSPTGWLNSTSNYISGITPTGTIGNNDYSDTIRHTISNKTKSDFENWLTNNGYTYQYEVTFADNGQNKILQSNQYRVVLRTGFHNIAFTYGGQYYPYPAYYDYHFWYQTNDGTWADKHGSTQYSEPEHLSSGITPESTSTTGWNLDFYDTNSGEIAYTYNNFYDGDFFVYIITY